MKTTPPTEVSEVPERKTPDRGLRGQRDVQSAGAAVTQNNMGLRTVTAANEVSGYRQIQEQIREALRAQHPEWLQPNGDSPACDYYEARFADILRSFARPPVNKKCVKIGNFCGATAARPLDNQNAQRESASLNKFHLRELSWT